MPKPIDIFQRALAHHTLGNLHVGRTVRFRELPEPEQGLLCTPKLVLPRFSLKSPGMLSRFEMRPSPGIHGLYGLPGLPKLPIQLHRHRCQPVSNREA
jgi:hypothetical protein